MASWNRLSGPVQQASDASTSKQQLRRASVASLIPLLGSAAVARLTWHRHAQRTIRTMTLEDLPVSFSLHRTAAHAGTVP